MGAWNYGVFDDDTAYDALDDLIESSKIISDMEKYFDAELCTASVEGDMEEFYYQWELCEDQYSEFQIDIPESLNQKIKLYDSWLDEEMISEETDEINITAKNEEQKSMDEIIKKFENEFLYTIYPTRIKNIESWISQSTLSSEQKRIFKELTEEYHILWSEFTYDEESMIFLEKLMMYKNLPFNVDEAVSQIYQYILEKSGVNKKQLEFFTSQLNKTGDSKAVWSKKQLEELFSDLFLENETFLEDMVNAGILDGDLVLVEQQATAENGEKIVALVNDSATVKTFYKEDGYFRLQPENDEMDPILVNDLQIVGKVIGVLRFLS